MPLRNAVHTDKLLSEISLRYNNGEFVAEEVFPKVTVKKNSDRYRIYTRNFRLPNSQRADKAAARLQSFDVTYSSYLLQPRALKDYVTDEMAENYDMADLRSDTTEELTDFILRQKERNVAELMTDTVWSLNVSLAATGYFSSNTTVSNPIIIFHTGATEIVGNSGKLPNYAVIPHAVMSHIKNHVSVLDRTKYTSKEMSPAIFAGLIDVEKVLVPSAQYDTSQEGLDETLTAIFKDNCFIGYKPARPGPRVPSAGYIFQKNIPMVRRWRDEEIQGDAIEVQQSYQVKAVATLCGFCIVDCI